MLGKYVEENMPTVQSILKKLTRPRAGRSGRKCDCKTKMKGATSEIGAEDLGEKKTEMMENSGKQEKTQSVVSISKVAQAKSGKTLDKISSNKQKATDVVGQSRKESIEEDMNNMLQEIVATELRSIL